jgi:hypothetical protein
MLKSLARRLGPAALLFAFLAAAVVGPAPFLASASSHREAPLISQDPQADNTDVYAFVSPDRQDSVTLVGDWIPFEAPFGGPNYFRFADEVNYEMHLDTIGDAKSHVTYRFQFTTHTRNPNTFLYNTGPINSLSDTDWNVYQTYTVTEIVSTTTALTTTVLAADLPSPPVNIGSKSTPNYDTLGDAAVCTISISGVAGAPTGDTCNTRGAALGAGNNNIKVFAGQRDDPFFVDLQVFDLLTLRGQGAPIGYTNGNNVPLDGIRGFNVHSIAMQIPISRFTGTHSLTGNNPNPIIGVWMSSSRPSMRVLAPLGSVTDSGPMVQVSRLGMPLTNEVVMPLALKDAFNGLAPEQDLPLYTSGSAAGNLLKKSVESPELAHLLCALYGVPLPNPGPGCTTNFSGPDTGRKDIFSIFLTGMKTAAPFTINTAGGPVQLPAGFNVNQPVGVVPAEMLRLNTGISGATCSPTPSRLGILGGDACGFPNGRRLADDVTDIELLAVGGAAWPVLVDNSFSFNPALAGALTDRIDQNDESFGANFPYVASPHPGQDPNFANIYAIWMMPLAR